MLTSVGFASHALAAAGFLAFAAYLGRRHSLTGPMLWLFVALLLTATWAAAIAGAAASGGTGLALLPLAETLRLAGWIAFLASMLAPSLAKGQRDGGSLQVIIALAVLLVVEAVINVAHLSQPPQPGSLAGVVLLFARIATAIGGLVLAHNVYVNALPSERWSIQLLCIAVAALFAYDLNFYTLGLLNGTPSIDLAIVRGAVNALVLPMLWLSIRRRGQLRLQLSRNAMFHSLSLGAIGLYLILMSVAAYGLKLVGGDWGRLFQISFLFAAAVLAITVLVSGRFRAWARVQINKNFFTYKYDYRTEWLRFIGTVSQTREGHGDLPMRVVQAVCTIIDSPGGGLFTRNDRGDYELAARWNYRSIGDIRENGNGALAQFLGVRGRIVDLDELRRGGGDYAGVELPAWAAADSRAWLIVPLLHIGQLAGFILVERSLVRRDLNWEDFDLLRTVGRQAASYIAEAGSQAALIEARKFDEFNRRFAFIMHDIKNLVSQLSLVARNAERHADNPEFRADMVKTLQSSVSKMNELLARLSQQNRARPDQAEAVLLGPIVEDVVATMRHRHAAIELTMDRPEARVAVDPQRIEQVLVHLIQNAIDAGTADDSVRVTLDRIGDWVRLTIADEGCGMSPAFVRSELFQPFRSTKAGGFGIGAYEARESIRAMGGNLEVASREGEGSVFTILLPALGTGAMLGEAAQ